MKEDINGSTKLKITNKAKNVLNQKTSFEIEKTTKGQMLSMFSTSFYHIHSTTFN